MAQLRLLKETNCAAVVKPRPLALIGPVVANWVSGTAVEPGVPVEENKLKLKVPVRDIVAESQTLMLVMVVACAVLVKLCPRENKLAPFFPTAPPVLL